MAGKVQVKTFNCLKCGGPLVSHGMLQTATIVCGNCGAIIDISDENYRILAEYKARAKETPRIPLGEKGLLRGEKWQVIGFMRRYISVDSEQYFWSEYLLFNPYNGFRWLTEYDGHWNYVRQSVERPTGVGPQGLEYRGMPYKHFQSATAQVAYVVGEFYWQVKAEDTCKVADYVAPPLMLSMENSDNEITWSLGEYIESAEIEKAFQLKPGSLPRPRGIYANQPSPYGATMKHLARVAGIFLAMIILTQGLTLALAQNKKVYSKQFNFDPNAQEKSVVSDVFRIDGRTSNVAIRTSATVSNAWILLNMALINDDSGVAYDVGREIEYYFGTDEDGAWDEGSRDDEVVIPSVPAGNYYLRIEPEGALTPVPYAVTVYRDTPSWRFFLIALLALAVIPVVAWIVQLRFEYGRWAESDHPWMSTSS